jgi:hypothetical protein
MQKDGTMISVILMHQLPRLTATQGHLKTKSLAALKAALPPFTRRVSRVAGRSLLQEALTKMMVFVFNVTKKDTWLEIVLMARRVLSSNLQRNAEIFSQVRHLGSGLVSGHVQVSESVFDLPSDVLEVIQGLDNKQFGVIMSDILNKNIILPTLLLPFSNVLDVNSKVYRAFSLIIPSVDDLQSFLRYYLHGKEGVPYETGACFIVDKHKTKNLKITLPRFKLIHQFESNSVQWQVYLDEPQPRVLNHLNLSS